MPIIYKSFNGGSGPKIPHIPHIHIPKAPKVSKYGSTSDLKWKPMAPTIKPQSIDTPKISTNPSAINFTSMAKAPNGMFARVGQRYRSIKKGISNGARKVSNVVTTGTKKAINIVAAPVRFVSRVGTAIASAPGQAAYRTYDYLKKGRLEALRANAQDKLYRLGSTPDTSTPEYKAKYLAYQMADKKLTLHKEETTQRNKLFKGALLNTSSLFDKKSTNVKTPSLTNMLTGRKQKINNHDLFRKMKNNTKQLTSLELARLDYKESKQEHIRETNKTTHSIYNNKGNKQKHTIENIIANPDKQKEYYKYLVGIGPENFNAKQARLYKVIGDSLQVEQYKIKKPQIQHRLVMNELRQQAKQQPQFKQATPQHQEHKVLTKLNLRSKLGSSLSTNTNLRATLQRQNTTHTQVVKLATPAAAAAALPAAKTAVVAAPENTAAPLRTAAPAAVPLTPAAAALPAATVATVATVVKQVVAPAPKTQIQAEANIARQKSEKNLLLENINQMQNKEKKFIIKNRNTLSNNSSSDTPVKTLVELNALKKSTETNSNSNLQVAQVKPQQYKFTSNIKNKQLIAKTLRNLITNDPNSQKHKKNNIEKTITTLRSALSKQIDNETIQKIEEQIKIKGRRSINTDFISSLYANKDVLKVPEISNTATATADLTPPPVPPRRQQPPPLP